MVAGSSALRCIKLLAFNSEVHRAVKGGHFHIAENITRCTQEGTDPDLVTIAKDVQATISMTT